MRGVKYEARQSVRMEERSRRKEEREKGTMAHKRVIP